jgi:hypothetical protein
MELYISYNGKKFSDQKQFYDEMKNLSNKLEIDFLPGTISLTDTKESGGIQVEYIETKFPTQKNLLFCTIEKIFYVIWDCTSVGFSTNYPSLSKMINIKEYYPSFQRRHVNLIIICSHGPIVLADCRGYFRRFRDDLTGLLREKFRQCVADVQKKDMEFEGYVGIIKTPFHKYPRYLDVEKIVVQGDLATAKSVILRLKDEILYIKVTFDNQDLTQQKIIFESLDENSGAEIDCYKYIESYETPYLKLIKGSSSKYWNHRPDAIYFRHGNKIEFVTYKTSDFIVAPDDYWARRQS